MAENGTSPKRVWKAWHFAVAALLGLVVLVVLVVGVRALYWAISPQDPKGRTDFTETVLHILGGLVLATGLIFTGLTLKVNRATQQENEKANRERERITLYTQAIDQLGSDKREVRLGGIYALERLARESDTDYQQVVEVFAAYIRENAPLPSSFPMLVPLPRSKARKRTPQSPTFYFQDPGEIRPPADIQAAIGALRRRRYHYGGGESFRIDLSSADLRGADLTGIHLENADISGTTLAGANLVGANLTEANLARTDLLRADLRRSDLAKADLREAVLMGAYLAGANLAGAYLFQADLTRANLVGANLTEAQLMGAVLAGASLTEALLAKARMRGVKLMSATLIDAQMMGALLGGADLTGAELMRANLTGAELRGTNLTAANLGGAQLKDAIFDTENLRKPWGLTWEQIAVARVDNVMGPIWQDGEGDLAALLRLLPDYVVVPAEPRAEPATAMADSTPEGDTNAPQADSSE